MTDATPTAVTSAADPWWRRTLELLKAAGKEFGADRAGRQAAALSYYTIFSLVPLLFLMAAIAGFLLGDPDKLDAAVAQITDVAGETVASTIQPLLETVQRQAGSALTIGVLLAAFSASSIFLQVQGVLNLIFQVPDEKTSGIVGFIVKRAIGLASAIVLAILVLAPIAAVGAVGFLTDLAEGAGMDWLVPILNMGVPITSLLLLMVVVGITFQAMTSVVIPWKAALRGGAATAIIGLVAAYAVGQFLGRSGSAEGESVSTLAVVGGLAILLFFFNLMWMVYLLGAEVTKVYSDYLDHGDIMQPSVRASTAMAAAGPSTRVERSDDRRPHSSGVFAFAAGAVLGWLGRKR